MASKVAIVTGGTRGLGRALSLGLAGAGYEVFAVWNADPEAAAALSDEWYRRGLNGRCIRCDLQSANVLDVSLGSDSEEVLLVHNAVAPFQLRPLHLLALADLEAQWSVAARGFILCTQTLLRPMVKAKRSTVVSVSSRALDRPPPKGFSGYVAAKASLVALTQGLAAEYGPRGVRVLVVSPSFMRTSLTEAWDPKLRDAVADSGESDPDQVARNIMKLVDDNSLPAQGESYNV